MIVDKAKQVAEYNTEEMDERQDPTKFVSQLFDKLDEVLKQSLLLKALLKQYF
jgi:hypothetical protein